MNEPVADHVRAIVDGHIVLHRKVAHQAHYPAIEVLESNSRLANELRSAEQIQLAQQALRALSTYREGKDMLDLGVYQRGANAELDRAVDLMPRLRQFLCQAEGEAVVWTTLEGFFWFPRTLLSFERLMLAYYDQPELIHRMNQELMDFNLRLLDGMGNSCHRTFRTIAEEMCYNEGCSIIF